MKKELSKNNKIKKAKLPFKKMSDNEKDYVAVVLEEVRDNFRAFGESLDFAQKKGDATFEEVGRIREELEEMNYRLNNIEQEVSAIRNEINSFKIILTQKADVEFLKTLEARLVIVERQLKLSSA